MNKPSRELDKVEGQEMPALFTAREFMAMAEAGLFDSWVGKIELAEGVVVHKSPPLNLHFHYQRQLFIRLHAIFGEGLGGWIVGQQPTFQLAADTVRCPDIAIMRQIAPTREINDHANLLLAAEVADTTLAEDRGPKRRSYAQARIPTYWIIDANGRSVELMSGPEGDDYRERRTIPFGEPMPVPGTDRTLTLD